MQNDNDLKRRGHAITKWLDEKGVERSTSSPDLNPIEHIWDEIEK